MTQGTSKNIVIDGTPGVNDIRAIQRYCFNMLEELSALDCEINFHLLYMGVKNYTAFPKLTHKNFTEVKSHIPGRILIPLWKLLNAPKVSWWIKDPIDLIHFPGGLPYIPTNCKKIVTTLHGFHYYFIPEFMNKNNSVKIKKELDFAIQKSTHLITVSEANKKEAIELWGIHEEQITAIPLGVSPEFKKYDLSFEERKSIIKKYDLPDKPFILFVGALEPHKNIKNIILSYNKLPPNLQKQYQLVLVGKETKYCKEYREDIISLGISDQVSFVDYIQPGSWDLAYLYNMAKLFVFPTFYEGWASPPLEAMKCGTPVVASNIPSLQESTGGIAMYPDPHSPEEICNSIQQLLEDKAFYEKQKEIGIEFVKKYTWKRSAEKTLQLYKKILNF